MFGSKQVYDWERAIDLGISLSRGGIVLVETASSDLPEGLLRPQDQPRESGSRPAIVHLAVARGSSAPLDPFIRYLRACTADMPDTELASLIRSVRIVPSLSDRFVRVLRGSVQVEAAPVYEEWVYERRQFFRGVQRLMARCAGATGSAPVRFVIHGIENARTSALDFLRFALDSRPPAGWSMVCSYHSHWRARAPSRHEFQRFISFASDRSQLIRLPGDSVPDEASHESSDVIREEGITLQTVIRLSNAYCAAEIDLAAESIRDDRTSSDPGHRENQLLLHYLLCLSQLHRDLINQALVSATRFLSLARVGEEAIWLSRALRLQRMLLHLHNDQETAYQISPEAMRRADESGDLREAVLARIDVIRSSTPTALAFREPEKLEAIFFDTLDMCSRGGFTRERSFVLSNTVFLMHLQRTNRMAKALSFCDEAAEIARSEQNSVRQAAAEHARGLLLQTAGDHESAAAAYAHSLRLIRRDGTPLENAQKRNGVGYFFFAAGEFRQALRHYRVALELLRPMPRLNELCTTLVNIAFCYTFALKHRVAAEYLDATIRIMDHIELDDLQHHPRSFILSLLGLNQIMSGDIDRGRTTVALLEYGEASHVLARSNRREYEYLCRAALAAKEGQPERFSEFMTRANQSLETIPGETTVIRIFARILHVVLAEQLGMTDGLAAIIEEAMAILRGTFGFSSYRELLGRAADGPRFAVTDGVPLATRTFDASIVFELADNWRNLADLQRTVLEINLLNELQNRLFSSDPIDEILSSSARLIMSSGLADAVLLVARIEEHEGEHRRFVHLEQPFEWVGESALASLLARYPVDPDTGGGRSQAEVTAELRELGFVSESHFPVSSESVFHGHLVCLSRDNDQVTERQRSRVLGVAAGQIASMVDVRTANARLQVLSTQDELTGLLNRRAIRGRIDSEILRSIRLPDENASRFCLLYVDLDGFKQYNDRFGHEAGDDVLRVVSGKLRLVTREIDGVGRLGGDEFLVLLTSCGLESATDVASRLLASLNEPHESIGKLVSRPARDESASGVISPIECSIGIAEYDPVKQRTTDEILHAADAALYDAKRSGKNRYAIAM